MSTCHVLSNVYTPFCMLPHFWQKKVAMTCCVPCISSKFSLKSWSCFNFNFHGYTFCNLWVSVMGCNVWRKQKRKVSVSSPFFSLQEVLKTASKFMKTHVRCEKKTHTFEDHRCTVYFRCKLLNPMIHSYVVSLTVAQTLFFKYPHRKYQEDSS
jgi:hypothetical protein